MHTRTHASGASQSTQDRLAPCHAPRLEVRLVNERGRHGFRLGRGRRCDTRDGAASPFACDRRSCTSRCSARAHAIYAHGRCCSPWRRRCMQTWARAQACSARATTTPCTPPHFHRRNHPRPPSITCAATTSARYASIPAPPRAPLATQILGCKRAFTRGTGSLHRDA